VCSSDPAVRQAGERVVLGQVHQLEREGARFADIVEHQHAADHVAGVVVDRRGGILHRRVEAVAMAQQGAAGQVGDGVAVDRGAQRVGHRPAVDGVEQLEHRLHRQVLFKTIGYVINQTTVFFKKGVVFLVVLYKFNQVIFIHSLKEHNDVINRPDPNFRLLLENSQVLAPLH